MRSLAIFLLSLFAPALRAEDPFQKWEKEIGEIEARLKKSPPKPGGLVFAGSSSIRLWDLKKSFPELAAINVGFGGSEIRDNTHFAARLILPLEPSTIVFYAGDNDINNGRTPEQVAGDFDAFAKTIHDKSPKCRIIFLAIKASPKRWNQYETQSKANSLIRERIAKDERFGCIDTVAPLLGKDGKPKPEYFEKDELHVNARGYALWASAVEKAIGK